jgi:hypothetical protein
MIRTRQPTTRNSAAHAVRGSFLAKLGIGATVGLAVCTGVLLAQQVIPRGTIKGVDREKGSIAITSEGKDIELFVEGATRFMDVAGQPITAGLNDPAFKPGVAVMFKAQPRDGRSVLIGLRLAGNNAQNKAQLPPPKVDMSAVKPLSDMAPGETYHGFEGGLYPDGGKDRPPAHEASGLALSRQIAPLDRDGKPSPEGKIVLLSVGMSNTMQAYSGFMRAAKRDSQINPKLVLVNGAQGGMTAALIQNPDGGRPDGRISRYWEEVDKRLDAAGVTRAQVQAAWIKQADAGPSQGFPAYAQTLQAELLKITQLLHDRFPNLRLVYLSNRTYGGYAKTRLNPEPYAYESGFSVKWLIEKQLQGDPAANIDPAKGPVKAPWLSWGPDLWANGTTPRADRLHYEESDFTDADGTHESPQGQDKIGTRLLEFFKSDTTTRGWFLGRADTP